MQAWHTRESITVGKLCWVAAAGQRLLAEQQDQSLRSILESSLTKLLSANDLKPSLDRKNKQVFRENLEAFVVNARSVVRVC